MSGTNLKASVSAVISGSESGQTEGSHVTDSAKPDMSKILVHGTEIFGLFKVKGTGRGVESRWYEATVDSFDAKLRKYKIQWKEDKQFTHLPASQIKQPRDLLVPGLTVNVIRENEKTYDNYSLVEYKADGRYVLQSPNGEVILSNAANIESLMVRASDLNTMKRRRAQSIESTTSETSKKIKKPKKAPTELPKEVLPSGSKRSTNNSLWNATEVNNKPKVAAVRPAPDNTEAVSSESSDEDDGPSNDDAATNDSMEPQESEKEPPASVPVQASGSGTSRRNHDARSGNSCVAVASVSTRSEVILVIQPPDIPAQPLLLKDWVFVFSNGTSTADGLFRRKDMAALITTMGGIVADRVETVQSRFPGKRKALISPFTARTVKYYQCIAANIPVLSPKWITDMKDKGQFLNFEEYRLPAALSNTVDGVANNDWIVPWTDRRAGLMRNLRFGFYGVSDMNSVWRPILKQTDATIVDLPADFYLSEGGRGILKECSYLILEDKFPKELVDLAQRFSIPTVITEWILDSLVKGELQPSLTEYQLETAMMTMKRRNAPMRELQ